MKITRRQHFYAALNLIGSHDVPRILTLLGGHEAQPDLPYGRAAQAAAVAR